LQDYCFLCGSEEIQFLAVNSPGDSALQDPFRRALRFIDPYCKRCAVHARELGSVLVRIEPLIIKGQAAEPSSYSASIFATCRAIASALVNPGESIPTR
jgi:hypothetical protein